MCQALFSFWRSYRFFNCAGTRPRYSCSRLLYQIKHRHHLLYEFWDRCSIRREWFLIDYIGRLHLWYCVAARCSDGQQLRVHWSYRLSPITPPYVSEFRQLTDRFNAKWSRIFLFDAFMRDRGNGSTATIDYNPTPHTTVPRLSLASVPPIRCIDGYYFRKFVTLVSQSRYSALRFQPTPFLSAWSHPSLSFPLTNSSCMTRGYWKVV